MRENYCIQDSLCEEQSKYKRVVRLEEASNEVPQPLTVEGSAGESFNYARADHEHPAIAPTPPTGDSSTKIATTEFVSNVLDELDYASVPNDNQVIYKVSQTDGLVSSNQKNISEVKLAGYTVGADNSGKVAASDTLGTALGKLQGQINGMDLAAVSGTGDIITSVSQTDGKVSATKTAIKDIKLTGYQKDGSIVIPIAATDSINNAFSKIENTFDGLEKTASAEDGKVVVTVTQSDGQVAEVKEVLKRIKIGGPTSGDGYQKTSETGAIGATDTLNTALSKLENNLENAINGLDDSDSAESGKFVTDVVQTNGKVTASNKSFISKTITADSNVETPTADLVAVVQNSAINFTTDPNQTVALTSVNVPTKKYVDDQITEAKSSVYRYKGSKENYSNLPTTGNTVGDVWNVVNESTVSGITYPAGTNWAWNGSSWDPLGGQVQVTNNNPTLGTTSQVIGTINGHELKASIPAYPTASSLGAVTTVNASGTAPLTLEATKSGTTVSITGSIAAATQSAAGTLSAADKKKLDELEAGAQVNQDAFSNVKVGSTTISADTKTDTLELVAGSNITLTPDAANDKITIAATDTTYTSKTAANGGTDVSLVTTGEKYIWNNKGGGSVTSVQVQATSPVVSSQSTAQSGTLNTTISLANGYGDTKNPYASKTKNYVLAAPSNANGEPTFRALVTSDIPNLSWNKITSDKPTTLSGYGITDASINNGTINIGGNSITPLTSQLWKESTTVGYISPSTSRNSLNGIDTIEATTIYQTSDRNMKQNIGNISQDDLNRVSNIELKKFEIKNNPGIIKYGVIAQEVQDAGLQNLVESNDRILRVDYISLLCLKIAALEEEIKRLKSN